ncbi:MAG: hypothetical protein K8E24_000545 [Methanobacterium paludis]|nr:hypothetical protein [Methanobacterium paludis]
MKLITLAKKEAQDILRNKIYLLVVFVQVFIIFGAFGLAVASSIAMDPNLLDSYGLYIGIVGFLVVPVLAYISRKSAAANISSMTIVMRLFSGESIPPGDYFIAILGILLLSIVFYWVAIKLFKRDDVVFGPRPGILRLLRDLVT